MRQKQANFLLLTHNEKLLAVKLLQFSITT